MPIETLDLIARADATADEAENIALTFLREGGNPSVAYDSLVSWLWHVITQRRIDTELRDWHGVLHEISTESALMGDHASSQRIVALADVLRVSISMEKRESDLPIMGMAHVLDILKVLSRANQGQLSREVLQKEVGLQTANLSRIVMQMVHAGLVDREKIGKQASFSITERGEAALRGRIAIVRGKPKSVENSAATRRHVRGARPKAGFASTKSPSSRQPHSKKEYNLQDRSLINGIISANSKSEHFSLEAMV